MYFLAMLVIGISIRRRVHNASDFFTAGGKMPWWLSGISHHMSGYSAAVFVGYAAIAYTEGFSLYIWWACTVAVALLIGSRVFAPRWVRLRIATGMISPLEFLTARYGPGTKLCLGCSGSLLKTFDVGAKWFASALLLQMFTNVSVYWGVLLIGGVTLIYSVAGGLWADAATDLSQFIIQLISGIAMCAVVLHHLGGTTAIVTIWMRLPPNHRLPFHGQYTVTFALVYLVVNLFSYNGGTWSLAQRFMASPNEASARKSALLSAALYLVWPLVLFYPMWAAPLLLPHLADPSKSYAAMAQLYLPTGMVGLVLAGMFAHSMAMTSSDANAVSAVLVRDIAPAFIPKHFLATGQKQLLAGRVCTFVFLSVSMIIAMIADHLGGVLGLILLWYGALVGPISVPMLLGMLPQFRRCGAVSAIAAWLSGIIAFGIIHWRWPATIESQTGSFILVIGAPLAVSLIVYVVSGSLWPSHDLRADPMLRCVPSSGAKC
ncbi:MAG: sodium:solute symporter family protein [Acidobacteriota bacterium]